MTRGNNRGHAVSMTWALITFLLFSFGCQSCFQCELEFDAESQLAASQIGAPGCYNCLVFHADRRVSSFYSGCRSRDAVNCMSGLFACFACSSLAGLPREPSPLLIEKYLSSPRSNCVLDVATNLVRQVDSETVIDRESKSSLQLNTQLKMKTVTQRRILY